MKLELAFSIANEVLLYSYFCTTLPTSANVKSDIIRATMIKNQDV